MILCAILEAVMAPSLCRTIPYHSNDGGCIDRPTSIAFVRGSLLKVVSHMGSNEIARSACDNCPLQELILQVRDIGLIPKCNRGIEWGLPVLIEVVTTLLRRSNLVTLSLVKSLAELMRGS